MSSRGLKVWSVLSLVGALVGVVGCADVDSALDALEPAEGTAQAPLSEKGAVANDDRRPPPGPHGPAFLLMAALHELDLSDAQETTIKGALDKIRPGEPGPRERAPFAGLATLAEGVRAGKIDEAAVLAKASGEGRAAEERGAAMVGAVASALDTLHTTLTKEQRRALVDAVTKRMEEHGPMGMKGNCGPGGERAGHGGPLGPLLSGLDLTDAQREAIDQALAAQRPAAGAMKGDVEAMKKRFEAGRAEMRARLEGFAADAFDAKAFVAPPEGAEARGPMPPLEGMVKAVSVVVPILEPAQRETLAARLEKGPPAPMAPHGGPMGFHGRAPQSAL